MEQLGFGIIGWSYWGPKLARNLESLAQAEVSIVADNDIHRLAFLANPMCKFFLKRRFGKFF